MKKLVIITGVTSFLGRNVAKKLIKENYEVIGILRPESKKSLIKDITGLKTITIDFNKIDLKEFNDIEYNYKVKKCIEKIAESNKEIYFIHFGWGNTLNRNDFTAQMLNVDYSKKVFDIAKLIGAKSFIFAGSQAEKSNITAYGMAKNNFADWASNNNDSINFIHLRIHSIYGIGDRDNSLIMSIIKSVKENKSIELSSLNYFWNFLYIDDFTDIISIILNKDIDSRYIYDIGSNDTRLLIDYVEEIKNILKAKNKFLIGVRQDSKEIFTPPNISNMMKAIGDYKFTKFNEGIVNIYKHYGR